ncbi:CAP domain-containing protein [Nocardioides sp. Bht2]|uniref:CAP domain-containing protein n=1 Tax=Nocardioides sp. Bht2 TaxID=3392297 RepID=UPI0039B69F28
MPPLVRPAVIAASVLFLALAGIAPATSMDTGATAGNPPASTTRVAAKVSTAEATWEKKILTITNKHRAKAGCKALKLNTSLRKAARKHSDLMARAKTLSHQLPGEASLGKRITRAGYRNWRSVGENVAFGYPTPANMMAAWMASPGHRKNILTCKYRHLGVGVTVKNGVPWATQDFGRK